MHRVRRGGALGVSPGEVECDSLSEVERSSLLGALCAVAPTQWRWAQSRLRAVGCGVETLSEKQFTAA